MDFGRMADDVFLWPHRFLVNLNIPSGGILLNQLGIWRDVPAGRVKSPVAMNSAEVAFGVVLLVLGTFILLAVSNPLEIAVYLGGPIMALLGLGLAIAALVRRAGLGAVVFGFSAFVLGALLGVHDFLFPPGIAVFVHLGIAIATLVLGLLQLLKKRRYLTRWLARPTA